MAGGLLNIKAHGQANILIFGNPQKTMFKAVYKSITNFGMQRMRVDFTGNTALMLTRESTFEFTIPRHADMVGDTYLCVTLPDVWSPFMRDTTNSDNIVETNFRWIKEIGTNMIKEVRIFSGSHTLATYTGEYFAMLAHRDEAKKKKLWDEMTGNIPELYDPGNAFGRQGNYPNSLYLEGDIMPEPSIRGRKLYIPLDTWFSRGSKMAFPLVALQYNDFNITITLRPVLELFTIRDIGDPSHNYPYLSPQHITNPTDVNTEIFFRPPEKLDTSISTTEPGIAWDPDIHILSTYYFLSKEERRKIAREEQNFLVKDLHRHTFLNATGPQTYRLYSMGLVTAYSFRFRRNDAFMRNEWSNYTNWPYEQLPYNIQFIEDISSSLVDTDMSFSQLVNNCAFVNSEEEPVNEKYILKELALLLDGRFRETDLDAGIYQYIEPYARTNTNIYNKEGLYYYSFATNMSSREYQPTGALNMDAFQLIQFQYDTIRPPLYDGSNANVRTICDIDGNIIGIRKNVWDLKEYNFDLEIFEERYNVVRLIGGNVGMYFAR